MMACACAISSRKFINKIIIINLFLLNFINEFQNCRYLNNFCKIFLHFCGNVTIDINKKVVFSKFVNILTIVLSTLHLNCTDHASII